jgi:hypothetical protein
VPKKGLKRGKNAGWIQEEFTSRVLKRQAGGRVFQHIYVPLLMMGETFKYRCHLGGTLPEVLASGI